MSMGEAKPVIALADGAPDWARAAVQAGGGVVGPLTEASALIHLGGVSALPQPMPDGIRWVQLPGAGIESYIKARALDERRVWTSAAGAYADTVAEHAVALLLAGVRGLVTAGAQRSWQRELVASRTTGLRGTVVTVVGAGGIGRRIIELLAAAGAVPLAVNRRGRPVPGARETLPAERLDEVWAQTDHVIVGAPATPDTRHIIDASVLARLKPTSWIVNIARGSLIDTDALVAALRAGEIGGAALDVTDPEPLPDGHPLWSAPNTLITPHTANPPAHQQAALAARVKDNVERFVAGHPLLGVIDVAAGY
jgi:D-3-phosphoglycerate dehydrogenase